MKTNFFLILSFVFLPGGAWAQTATPTLPKQIPAPFFLKPTDKIPMKLSNGPEIQDWDPYGSKMEYIKAINAPPVDILVQLSEPYFFETIKAQKKNETQFDQVYSHDDGDLNYEHFRDKEGSNWYGWCDGKVFNWVLLLGNRYWWHDDFAGHWLYFAKGYWWRADGQSADQLQVLINGEYYECGRDGTILRDMGQDGNGNIMSAPGRYKGDFHHSGGGHGGHGGHNGSGHSAAANSAGQ